MRLEWCWLKPGSLAERSWNKRQAMWLQLLLEVATFSRRGRTRFSRALDWSLPDGQHILNGVGADLREPVDLFVPLLDRFSQYRLRSARDYETQELLERYAGPTSVVPCVATLLRPLDPNLVDCLPGHEELGAFRDRSYAVVHHDGLLSSFADQLRLDTVRLEMQQWRRQPYPKRGNYLLTHSPSLAATVVRYSRFVVTRSLHLAIFAIAMGVPFVVLDAGDAQGAKVRRYMQRANCEDLVVRNLRETAGAIRRAESKIESLHRSEYDAATAHVRRMVSSLHTDGG